MGMCPAYVLQLKNMLKKPKAVRLLVYAAIAQGVLGCLTSLLGAVAPEWVYTEHGIRAGLLLACNGTCEAFAAEGAIVASKVFVVIAFFYAVAGVIDLLVYYIRFFRHDVIHRSLPMIAAVLYFIAVVLQATGVIIFAAQGKTDAEMALESPVTLGYAFTVTIIAGVILALAGISSLLHRSGLANVSEDIELQDSDHPY
ncbi:unnamed protein product [Candidula unifasciata]|uniref:Uncharacterized protein n=1 Tax=Candidula unifasciata TaxID=100452 RepID=A0A8S3Z900_9EUPU|nr:unnamed protein product [Candidula unifasciata]